MLVREGEVRFVFFTRLGCDVGFEDAQVGQRSKCSSAAAKTVGDQQV
jgi:hypothetical protein